MRVRSGGLRPYTADAVAPESRRRLRALAAALPAALLGALILAPAASAGWFLPESAGSPNADAIRTLYILIALIGLVIFVGVEGLLIYSLVGSAPARAGSPRRSTATPSSRSAGRSAPPRS